MTKSKPHILVCNDDGVHTPGLLALAQSLRQIAEVTILAPDRNWSASGHVKTLHKPLHVRPVTLSDGSAALACDGAPSDCVALALMGVVPEPVDLVVSGINPFPNLSTDMLYSGTVSVAVESVIFGVPGIAVSTGHPDDTSADWDYSTAASVARQVVEKALAQGPPKDLLLNVNVPYLPADQLAGWELTRMGQRIYRDSLVTNYNPRGQPYYWIGGEFPGGVDEPGTDIGALNRGCVSIMPLSLDLTDYPKQDSMRSDGWER
jgi:5'-nucleotidase